MSKIVLPLFLGFFIGLSGGGFAAIWRTADQHQKAIELAQAKLPADTTHKGAAHGADSSHAEGGASDTAHATPEATPDAGHDAGHDAPAATPAAAPAKADGAKPEAMKPEATTPAAAKPTAVPAKDDAAPQAEQQKLAKIFSTMSAKDAARVLAQMSDADVQVILGKLSDRQAAAILTSLPPQRAATLSASRMRPGTGEQH